MTLYIGLMSGTSMDGIDCALTDVESNRLVYGLTIPYSPEVQERLNTVQSRKDHSLASICELNILIGREFAAAVEELLLKSHTPRQNVVAIGSHGQTLCHNADADIPYTFQIGCAHSIAQRTGRPVVADFRVRDILAGGQGAPLAPLYHRHLFDGLAENIGVVNIGGISNISLLTADNKVFGWDVGPGNCLMDYWTSKHLNQPYDSEGNWAAKGEVIPELLDRLLADPFIKQASPKSIGKEYFSQQWLDRQISPQDKPVDVQATLLAFTAKSVVNALKEASLNLSAVYLCGGGSHNQTLLQSIASLMPETAVESIAAKGISPDYLEAMIFAWLAEKTLHNRCVDLRAITGSRHPVILGAVYPSPSCEMLKA